MLKLVIAVVGLACMLGGAAVMYFGMKFMKNETVDSLTGALKYIPYGFIFGSGSFLILVGIVQLVACKTENRCCIFIYEGFAIVVFLVTATFLGLCYWYKGEIIDMVEKALATDAVIPRMYSALEANNDNIFIKEDGYCFNKTRVQDCSTEDKSKLFKSDVPEEYWFILGSAVEKEFKCSGFNHTGCRYFFSGRPYFLKIV